MTDEWKPVDGFSGRYEVSRYGRVRRTDGLLLNPLENQFGYPVINLRGKGFRKLARVHRLVAQAFIPNPDGLPCVNHIDHCRQNNNVENLEWCSQKENLAHARRAGRMTNYWKGRRSPNAALLDEQVRQIRREYALGGVSWDKLARKHELSKRAIGRVLRRETYTDV